MKKSCILGKINEINSVSNKFIEKKIKEEGLQILKNHIPLFYILPEDGSALVFSEISNIWKISKSSLSDIVNKYENQGLIKKCICAEDKRSVYISLKPEALYIKQKIESIEVEILDLMLKGFDRNERQIFEENFDKVLKNIKQMQD
ncbi:MarR family winged helix-turn-helix transcriptional regulator [Clostridium estertheticum]|uniref:MarR family transcriptional regulator n=1 Tax=Clostridium estertheticum TaxID=238834 RepID=A0A7Y3WSY9_9CLOT|nr:MarR family transcriptional regulator [Clostridium estertheticum]NNU77622.1 MarR family transcriptional regulator [Clostridium estertheticum]WBL48083.1 MarR family transcriptional regulator [Clostridium estertheticum]